MQPLIENEEQVPKSLIFTLIDKSDEKSGICIKNHDDNLFANLWFFIHCDKNYK